MERTAWMLFLFLLIFFSSVSAEVVLPADLTVIEAEAFQGDISLEEIIIPDHLITIRSRAFADTALKSITIPPSVISISSDAFEDVSVPMLIEAEPDSYAVLFALRNNLDFRADTVSRALIIGQINYPAGYKLNGPAKDIVKMSGLLEEYDVTVIKDLDADGILNAVSDKFSEAKQEDISLLYYSGHGNSSDGALIGIDLNSYVTPADLRSVFDSIPGRKIVIIDACYSGVFIGKSTPEGEMESSDPAALFINAFTARRPLLFSNLAADQYFVMVSSKGDEESWEASYGGVFTDSFVKSKTNADADMDQVVSFEEAYQYTKNNVVSVVRPAGKVQSVQVYPENCFWFGLFR